MEYTIQDENGNLVPVRSSVPPRMQPRPAPPKGDRVVEDATPPRMQKAASEVPQAGYFRPISENLEIYSDLSIPEKIGRVLGGTVDIVSDAGSWVGDSASGLVDIATDIGSGVAKGFTESDQIPPKPEVPEESSGDVTKIIEAAQNIPEEDVNNTLSQDQQIEVDNIAERVSNAIQGGHSPKEAIEKGSSFLGGLFGDKNIQRALVYYLGARLMGYSGSGSGMAAGQVLLSGMEADDKAEKLRLKSEAESAAKNAIDMSKVVDMVDHKGNFISSYVSPNGKFFRPVDAPEDVAYQVSTSGVRLAKTGEENRDARINNISQNVRNNMRPAIIASLKSQVKSDARPEGFEQQNIDIAEQIFSEAGISDQLIQNIIDTYGLEYLETKGQTPLRNAMEQFAREVASGGIVNIASAQGQFDRMMMKAANKTLPREIYMLDGNMASSDAQNKLSKRIRDINAVRSQALEKLYARKDLTPTEVRQEEVRINKLVSFENVFKRAYEDFKNRKSNKQFNTYWTNIAKNNKSTPFIEWVTDKAETGKEFNSFLSLVGKDENYFIDLLGLSEQSTKKE